MLAQTLKTAAIAALLGASALGAVRLTAPARRAGGRARSQPRHGGFGLPKPASPGGSSRSHTLAA